ncbi:hypothetical protein BU15DRAFT_55414, partial [Melanogaster broomeanus]
LLLINAQSFPMVWHARIMVPLGVMRCKYHLLSYQHILSLQPVATRHSAVVNRLESLCPVGVNPFDFAVRYTSWASPDDIDFFGHLSNSSYAKNRDCALSKFIIQACPTFVCVGGWIALGSTQYHFLREIPVFASYEIKLSIGAWDQKWMYIVCCFILRPKNNHQTKTKPDVSLSLPKYSSTSCGISTLPSPGDSESTTSNHVSRAISKTLAASLIAEGPDGANIHCFSVSRVCFKLGRITVLPALLLACEGFSKPPMSGSYSCDAPPPHWIHPHTLRDSSGSLDGYRRFLTGLWRDVAGEDRWWIEPLSGPVEEQRRENLAKLEQSAMG